MDTRMLVQLGAVVFVAVAMTVTIAAMWRKDDAAIPTPRHADEAARDPLRDAQRRCQRLGQQAAGDAACLRVWGEARDRFLRRSQRSPDEGR